MFGHSSFGDDSMGANSCIVYGVTFVHNARQQLVNGDSDSPHFGHVMVYKVVNVDKIITVDIVFMANSL